MSKRIDQKLIDLFKGKFNYWNHSDSFSSNEVKPDLNSISDLLDPKVELFSVIVTSSHYIPQKLFDNPKFFKKTIKTYCSILEQQARIESISHTASFNNSIEKEIKKRFKLTEKTPGYWNKFDLIVAERVDTAKKEIYLGTLYENANYYISDQNDKFHKGLTRKINQLSEASDSEFGEIIQYYLDKNPKVKKIIHKKITQNQKEVVYTRNFKNQLPGNLCKILYPQFLWQQIYVYKKGSTLKLARGSTVSSGSRENHGYFGHLFAEAQNKGKDISTFLVNFNSNLSMKTQEIPELALFGHDLTGNYRIDLQLSKKILAKIKLVYSVY